jgi:hypothetical protein
MLDRYGHLLPGREENVPGALDQLADRLLRDGRGTPGKTLVGWAIQDLP